MGGHGSTGFLRYDIGPITLFGKSFLQSLSVEESVCFDHFSIPVIRLFFFVEALADLEKAVRQGRAPEQEVGIIATKVLEMIGGAAKLHARLALGNLTGKTCQWMAEYVPPLEHLSTLRER